MKTLFKVILPLSIVGVLLTSSKSGKPALYKPLRKYTSTLANEFNQITEERKQILNRMGDFILAKRRLHEYAELTFVCTSNSRRSHLAQTWMQTAGLYYGIDSLFTFSGGTESTEVNARAMGALSRAGFGVNRTSITFNGAYEIFAGKEFGPWLIFSKKYDDSQNPKSDFCAIMVCSEADKSCPVIPGAGSRLALPYDDPKYYDNTPAETQKYDETCRLIAREMFFVCDYVKREMILVKESAGSK